MRKLLALLSVFALSACAAGGMQTQTQLPPQSPSSDQIAQTTQSVANLAGTNWTIGTGASYDSYAVQDLDFLPNAITIDAGDTITYHVGSGAGGDAHTVAFVPPGQTVPPPGDPANLSPAGGNIVDGTHFLNSGILVGGQTFTLHFPVAGTFKILCLFHEPAMVMTVTVQKAGTPYPHDATFYLHAGAVDEQADFFEGRQSVASFPFVNGGNTFAAGIDPGQVHFPPPDSTVLRFLNSSDFSLVATSGSKTIKVGTVLKWVNLTSNEPHTITLVPAGQHSLPNMPPDPAVNVAAPGHITTFDGTKLVNSGTVLGGHSFLVKFIKAGTFFYGCLYHDNSRMTGTITVTP
jgi:plastocyanin